VAARSRGESLPPHQDHPCSLQRRARRKGPLNWRAAAAVLALPVPVVRSWGDDTSIPDDVPFAEGTPVVLTARCGQLATLGKVGKVGKDDAEFVVSDFFAIGDSEALA
jgi:hypothetical protein